MFTPAICFSLRHVQIVLPEVRRSPGQIRKYLHSLCESGVSQTRNQILLYTPSCLVEFRIIETILFMSGADCSSILSVYERFLGISFISLSLVIIRLNIYFFFIIAWINSRWVSCMFSGDALRDCSFFKIRWDFHTYEKYQASHRTWNRRAYPLRFDYSTLWLHDIRLFFC